MRGSVRGPGLWQSRGIRHLCQVNWGVRTADGQGLIWDRVCHDRQERCLLVLVLGKLLLGSQGTMAFV